MFVSNILILKEIKLETNYCDLGCDGGPISYSSTCCNGTSRPCMSPPCLPAKGEGDITIKNKKTVTKLF